MASRTQHGSPRERSGRAVYEPIVPSSSESFVWRRDGYPLPWCVWNYHPECEIHLILKSTGTCYVGDYIGSFSPGSLYFIGKNLPHNWVTPLESSEFIVDRDVIIQFEQDRLLGATGAFPELRRATRLLQMAGRGMSFHGRARHDGASLVEAMGGTVGLRRLSLLFELLDLMANTEECTTLSSATFTPNLDDDVNRILRDTLGYLASRLQEDLRLSEIAEVAGMTETSFSRFFKKNTGNTFTRHLSELRISRACQLLSESDKPVTEVCHDVGYLNLSNFNKVFRELRGMTPRDYRRLATSRKSSSSPTG